MKFNFMEVLSGLVCLTSAASAPCLIGMGVGGAVCFGCTAATYECKERETEVRATPEMRRASTRRVRRRSSRGDDKPLLKKKLSKRKLNV